MITIQAVGRLTKDAVLNYTNNGKSVANFTMACKRKHTDKDGNPQTTYVRCVLWGKRAELLAKYTRKGALVSLDGELTSRQFDDQQGITQYITEITVENFDFLESKEIIQQREQKQCANDPETKQENQAADTNQTPNTYDQGTIDGMNQYGSPTL